MKEFLSEENALKSQEIFNKENPRTPVMVLFCNKDKVYRTLPASPHIGYDEKHINPRRSGKHLVWDKR